MKGIPVLERRIIYALVVVGLCVNVASFCFFRAISKHNPSAPPFPVVTGDSQAYVALAQNNLQHDIFSDSPDLSPSRSWPPGYPAILAISDFLTGSFVPVAVLQIIFAAFASALIYLMARRFVSPIFAACAAFLFVLDPEVVLSNTVILTDSLCVSLLISAVYVGLFQRRFSSVTRFALAALLLSVATLIRPIIEFVALLMPFALMYAEWESGKRVAAILRSLFIYVCVCAVILLPWMIRNERLFGSLEVAHVGASDLLGIDVRDFLAWRTLAIEGRPMFALLVPRHLDDPVYVQVDVQITQALARATPPGGNPDNEDAHVALSFILADPIRYAYFHIINTIPFFIGSSVSAYGQSVHQERDNTNFYAPTMNVIMDDISQLRGSNATSSRLSALRSLAPILLETLAWLCVCALCVVALFRRQWKLFVLAILVLLLAALVGPVALVRYRIQAEPFMFILAAAGLEFLLIFIKDFFRTERTSSEPLY